jgi:chemotaxis protein histidine kinase CheA
MERRLVLLTVVTVLAFASLACGQTGPSGPQTAAGLAAEETALAQATRDAYDNEARATAAALDNQERATRQAQSARATEQASHVQATRTAQEAAAQATAQAHAVEATTTAQAVAAVQATEQAIAQATAQAAREAQATANAQATATRVAATATAESWQAASNATAINATAQAVARQNEREKNTQALTTFAGWFVAGLAVVLAGVVAYLFLPILARRAQVIRRRRDEGEPLIVMERDPETGLQRVMLPLRSFGPVANDEAPAPGFQDRATARQQAANLMLARNAHRAPPRRVHKIAPPPPQRGARPARRRRDVPGLVRVVDVGSLAEASESGMIPKRLVEAIDTEWEVLQ